MNSIEIDKLTEPCQILFHAALFHKVTGVLSSLATQKAKSKKRKMLDGFFN